MEGRADSGIEIRRILLLTRLQKSPRGLTMNQLVRDCSKVDGWNILGTGLWEGVRIVLQSLINDGLVALKTKFLITMKGRDYLADPLKWRLNVETAEEVERKLFWNSIYEIFDKALTRLRARSQPSSRKE
ncbi:hypothetical protein E6H15_03385 [Candidatus Bathyarchaeota archaeon]|nr:MAG: hypothetical protein E6H25_02540 [Candidatus Bathyarchaeota archaeon]TMI38014.1 MAG: hypothetical protein E6H26_01740 [Candidatus Bathyarchaeota archaeon]TMI50293.1 MAG: hypothetical protein E6H22_01765 [Candidatus Bathyarchaeota archaeon]TMI55573.1 MAG: hypothetical protein E6H15_03385 [Candidatus Bathyarchaeota archaeon]